MNGQDLRRKEAPIGGSPTHLYQEGFRHESQVRKSSKESTAQPNAKRPAIGGHERRRVVGIRRGWKDESVPGVRSLTSTVPASVPSLFHNSRPCTLSFATKNTVRFTRTESEKANPEATG